MIPVPTHPLLASRARLILQPSKTDPPSRTNPLDMKVSIIPRVRRSRSLAVDRKTPQRSNAGPAEVLDPSNQGPRNWTLLLITVPSSWPSRESAEFILSGSSCSCSWLGLGLGGSALSMSEFFFGNASSVCLSVELGDILHPLRSLVAVIW